MSTLSLPNSSFKNSFLKALDEFNDEGLWTDLDKVFLENRFEDYIIDLERSRKGLGLPLGFVASTEYWLIDNRKFIGRINIRHKLTPALKKFGGHIGYEIRPSERKKGYAKQMIKQVLPHVLALNITEALITCDSDNVASQKVIESVGGQFKDEIKNEGHEKTTFRYWVYLETEL